MFDLSSVFADKVSGTNQIELFASFTKHLSEISWDVPFKINTLDKFLITEQLV